MDDKVLASVLSTVVQFSFDHYLYSNSLFFAERLAAFAPHNEEATFLVAQSLYYSGQPQSVYSMLKGSSHPRSKYLFARSCYDLSHVQEGEMALTDLLHEIDQSTKADGSELCTNYPDKSAVLCLLGLLCKCV